MADYEIPDDLAYTESDEWLRSEGDRVLIGVTDYAQQQLGDVVLVDIFKRGETVEKGEPFGVIESVKAVSDLIAPVSGEVVDVNADLESRPELVNEDCYGDGWMVAITVGKPAELESQLDAKAYARYIEERQD